MAKTLKTINANASKLAELEIELAQKMAALKPLKDKIEKMRDKQCADMVEAGISSIQTEYGRLGVTTRTVASVTDWAAFDAYAIRKKAPELYQRRVNLTALRERSDAGEMVPGVIFDVVSSLTFSKGK